MKDLPELLLSTDENERKQAIVLLSRKPTKDAADVFQNLADTDPSVEVRFLAKKALNMLQEGAPPAPRTEAPANANEQKIKTYLEGAEKEKLAIIQHLVTNRLKRYLPMLIDRLNKESETTVLSSLIMASGKLGTPADFHHVEAFFDHPNPRIRASAVEVAGQLASTQAYSHVLRLLEDTDNRVRGNALMVIKNLGPANTLKVIKSMADSNLMSMKSSAAFALRFFPDESNLEILVELLDSPDVNVRNNALKTLEIFRDKGVATAGKLLSDMGSEANQQQETVETLERGIAATAIPEVAKIEKAEKPAASTPAPVKVQAQIPTPAPAKKLSEPASPETEERLPEKFIGSSGRGSLAEHLKPFVQQSPPQPGPQNSLDQILVWARTVQASDIHISPGKPVMYRQFGLFKTMGSAAFTVDQVKELLDKSPIDPGKLAWFYEHGDIETVIVISGAGRFRVTLMKHLGGINISARVIPWIIRTFEETRMPPSCKGLTKWAQGLVLITGPVGSGKTSTLSTFVEMINQIRNDHIITIEKPIEIVFEPAKCQISQREVGCHTLSQNNALKGALREDPDILVVSELRDLDSIQLAISAAETGHLVFGTLNTINATRTVSRITDSFAPEEQAMLQNMLSESLRGIVCQQLIPRKDGTGVVPAYEVLIVTTAVSNMIRKEGVHQLASVMTMGKAAGMVTMDQSLRQLAESGVISGEEAWLRAESKREFEKFLQKKA